MGKWKRSCRPIPSVLQQTACGDTSERVNRALSGGVPSTLYSNSTSTIRQYSVYKDRGRLLKACRYHGRRCTISGYGIPGRAILTGTAFRVRGTEFVEPMTGSSLPACGRETEWQTRHSGRELKILMRWWMILFVMIRLGKRRGSDLAP
jgi:hypothetical protein